MMSRYFLAILFSTLLLLAGCSPPAADSPVAQGKSLFAEGKWDAAIQAYDTAIAKNPLDAEAYLCRGQAYMCKGREHVGHAIADYNDAIRIDGKNHEAYYLRALAYKERGDTELAYADEMKARKLDPNVAKVRASRPAPSLKAYEESLELTRELGGEAPNETVVKEEFESFPERETIPGVKQPEKESAKENEESITALDKPAAGGEVRDAYGLPLSTKRVGSLTEQLFGPDPVSEIDEEEPAPRRRPSMRRRQPPADWQSQAPGAPALPSGDSPLPAKRPSPIGTLPFGNPYQSRGMNPYSPYSNPYGPRTTGLRGDPALRDYPVQGGGYSGRDPNAVPRQPGGQPPLVDPR